MPVAEVLVPVPVPELWVANEVTVVVAVEALSVGVDTEVENVFSVEESILEGADEVGVRVDEGSLLVEVEGGVGVGVEELVGIDVEGGGVVDVSGVDVGVSLDEEDEVGGGVEDDEEVLVVSGGGVDDVVGVSLVEVVDGSSVTEESALVEPLVGLADMVNCRLSCTLNLERRLSCVKGVPYGEAARRQWMRINGRLNASGCVDDSR